MTRRDRLKHATREQHLAIERIIERRAYFSSVSQYALWLEGSLAFYRDLARDKKLGCDVIPDAPGMFAARAARLAQDLADIGRELASAEPEHDRHSLPRAEEFGVLYVTEGSTLGSRQLLVRARELGMTEWRGARHLSHLADNLSTWRHYLHSLEEAPLSTLEEEHVIEASRRTFALAAACYDIRR